MWMILKWDEEVSNNSRIRGLSISVVPEHQGSSRVDSEGPACVASLMGWVGEQTDMYK